MNKYILLITACCFLNQPLKAVYDIKGADDEELSYVSNNIAKSRGHEAPTGWEIDKNSIKLGSTTWNNMDLSGDKSNYLEHLEIEKKLSSDGERNSLKVERASMGEINVEIERYDHSRLGEEFVTHYVYSKKFVLKKVEGTILAY